MEQEYTIHCWQLKHQLDSDDDTNDLHIAFDVDDMNYIGEMLDQISKFELNLFCEPFPEKSPQHFDVGMETYMKNYKSEVLDFEKLTLLITHEEDEILMWTNGKTEAFIKLTDKKLKEMKKVMQHTKNNAYLNENVVLATRITEDNEFKPCKIIFWAATNGIVIYY